jgi:hypothetical protein
MKYLARDTAFGKLKAMVEGTAIVRREFTGSALLSSRVQRST